MASIAHNPDELVSCPYNTGHVVSRKRFHLHLLKCEKDPKSPKLARCQFDISHRIAPELLQAHLLECPAARGFVRELSTAKPPPRQPADAQEDEPYDTSDPWAEEGKAEGDQRPQYLLPGLGKGKSNVVRGDGSINVVALQTCKAAERKKIYAELAARKPGTKSDHQSPVKEEEDQDSEENKNYQPRLNHGIGRGKPKVKNENL